MTLKKNSVITERNFLTHFIQRALIATLFALSAFISYSQQPVTIRIETKDNLLLLGVDTNAMLKQLYFGRIVKGRIVFF